MKPTDVAALLSVLRHERVAAFELGEFKVTFHPSAFVPMEPAEQLSAALRGVYGAPTQKPAEPEVADEDFEDPDEFYHEES